MSEDLWRDPQYYSLRPLQATGLKMRKAAAADDDDVIMATTNFPWRLYITFPYALHCEVIWDLGVKTPRILNSIKLVRFQKKLT
jgi:hypothetical protein